MKALCLTIVLAPLIASIVAGLFGRVIGRNGTHWLTILGVAVSFVLSLFIFKQVIFDQVSHTSIDIYQWLALGDFSFKIGFLIDPLTVTMMLVVTFVSLMVHIYTIGYMHDDPGYQRFFSYISLFTFSMLMLVMANNFLQLFFGWEAVGLVSYLLIGFWYTRDSAIFANMKAFLVNRVGDFGFLLGIGAVLAVFNTLDYQSVFAQAPLINTQTFAITENIHWPVMTVICLLLFVGAMGKSAQVPLHVWLPDSMEGPTPISALIHAATMVTAGIFMVARMSPLFELSDTALNFMLIIGAITAFFMGLVGIVQNDIKRVVAYSTLSQLGYMTVALGASAYSIAIFHLFTHAFFKALLFLGAGSVIVALHHEQDMRKMGGLRKYMPITYWTAFIGTLALIGFPGFAGFFSKDSIIEAVHYSNLPAAEFAYWLVLAGVFVTAFYSFRLLFLVFHGDSRMDKHTEEHVKESSKVITIPLILLAIPSVFAGLFIGSFVFGDYFAQSIFVAENHHAVAELKEHYHGIGSFVAHAFKGYAVYLAFAGIFCAWFLYLKQPQLAESLKQKLHIPHKVLSNKYGIDELYQILFATGARKIGAFCDSFGDRLLIDGLIVNGSAKIVSWFSAKTRTIQTGYLYHYAFAMIIGLLILLSKVFLQ
ncbi:MAG: NADH-quinone oxidoreductase subunit L [Gammaproteobacteria bacterium]|nr:MAG: NADH-quinone oxidoreductase subunit L [Gammaproteobacteria bacterium]